ERVGRIIFGTKQAFLLGGNCEEDDRTVGLRAARPHARLVDQLRNASPVVDRAIVDLVAGSIRLADAKMVPVRRVDDRLVRVGLACNDANDVMAVDDLRACGIARCQRRFEGHGLEARAAGSNARLFEIEARALKNLNRDRALDPAFEWRVMRSRTLADDVE